VSLLARQVIGIRPVANRDLTKRHNRAQAFTIRALISSGH